jgi:anti-sigma regulatory factor (Ser/Thr protein kinase)
VVHEALLYRDVSEFLTGTAGFLEEGIARGDAAMAALPEPRLSLLRAALGDDAGHVRLVDMGELGRNPSRILPAIATFVEEHEGAPVRFIGEPSWPGRRECEAIEASRHEALINLAFGHLPWVSVLCPYDAERLTADRLEDAERTHPHMICGCERRPSTAYTDPVDVWAAAERPLPDPTAPLARFTVDGDVGDVRRSVRAHAQEAGLPADAVAELLIAASEAVTNALLHALPPIAVTMWLDEHDLVCDVDDAGRFTDPLAGRRRPPLDAIGGRGLWIVNQLCDLVEIRSGDRGTTVRLRMQRTA